MPSAVLLLMTVLAGCGGTTEEPAGDSPAPSGTGPPSFARADGEPGEGEFLAGLPVASSVPDDPSAVLVLVPGGAWRVTDPTGFTVLGEDLASRGPAAVTITYGTADSGVYHPASLLDIACGVAYAAQVVPDVPVVVVGHSAGAHLAALVGLLAPEDPGCPYPPHAADAVVGLAGPYATSMFRPPELLGPAADEQAWTESDAHTHVALRPDVPFLLVHGDADEVTPAWFSTRFGQALEDAGHPVTVEVLTGLDHEDVIRPEHVADLLAAWAARTFPATAGD